MILMRKFIKKNTVIWLVNMSDIKEVFQYFYEILDIPPYYRFVQTIQPGFTYYFFDYEIYAHIDNVCISLLAPEFNLFYHKDTVVNDRIILYDNLNRDMCYELLYVIDTYSLLIIDDIIKTLGGVLL